MGFKRSNYAFLQTDLYALLWSKCHTLRGDMDLSNRMSILRQRTRDLHDG